MFAARKAVASTVSSSRLIASSVRRASTNATPQRTTQSIKNVVEAAIAENQIMMFSKTHCPYSTKAKGLFASQFPSIPVKVVELDELAEGSSIQDYLLEKTGQRTVPNVFINQRHVGGSDTVAALNSQGKLADLLNGSPVRL